MSSHGGTPLLSILGGVMLILIGALTTRYPEAMYAIRTAWKHDQASLSSRGRTDQRMMGVIVFLIGIGLILHGLV